MLADLCAITARSRSYLNDLDKQHAEAFKEAASPEELLKWYNDTRAKLVDRAFDGASSAIIFHTTALMESHYHAMRKEIMASACADKMWALNRLGERFEETSRLFYSYWIAHSDVPCTFDVSYRPTPVPVFRFDWSGEMKKE